MGRGGEKVVDKSAKAPASKSSKKMKLEHMPTEELKKWALAYGVDAEKDRDALLAELVRSFHQFMIY